MRGRACAYVCVYCLCAFACLYKCVYDCACACMRMYLRESVCVFMRQCVRACGCLRAWVHSQCFIGSETITCIISLVNCVLTVSADRRFRLSWSSYETRRVLFLVAVSHCFYINKCHAILLHDCMTRKQHKDKPPYFVDSRELCNDNSMHKPCTCVLKISYNNCYANGDLRIASTG